MMNHLPVWNGEDFDMTWEKGRSLLQKSSQALNGRKRVPSTSYLTLPGGRIPRQGFLSTELMRSIYTKSELVRACVDTLIEMVSGADWLIKPVDEDKTKWLKRNAPDKYLKQQKRIDWLKKFFAQPSKTEDLESFHRKLLRDLLIFDAGAYEMVWMNWKGKRLPQELGVVPGDTIEFECDAQGIPEQYWQSHNVLSPVEFEEDEIAYLQMNPCSWQPYGISPIETAYVSVCSDIEANNYNWSFFQKDGIPAGLLAVMGVSESEYKKIMAQIRQVSHDNPHNLHSFRAQRSPDGTNPKVFEYIPLATQSNRDMQFDQLIKLTVNRVCMLYRTSPSQIGFTEDVSGGIGSGAADGQADVMQDKGVAPILRKLAKTHTTNVIWKGCGWRDLEFAFQQSNTPAEKQEYDRGVQELSLGATTINEFRSRWGGRKALDWGDMPMSNFPYFKPPPTPQELQQQLMGMQAPPPQPGDPNQQTDPNQPPPPNQPPQNQQQGGQPPKPPGMPPKPGAVPPQLQKSVKRIVINL